MGLESRICFIKKLLYYGTKHDGRHRNVNKTPLHANSSGLPQHVTKTRNGASSHDIFVDHCCEITESSEIDLASSALSSTWYVVSSTPMWPVVEVDVQRAGFVGDCGGTIRWKLGGRGSQRRSVV